MSSGLKPGPTCGDGGIDMKLYGWFGLLLLISFRILPHPQNRALLSPGFIALPGGLTYCWRTICFLKLRGRSLLTHRRKELWSMLPLSVFIWLLFEAYNFVMHNWSYNIAPLPTMAALAWLCACRLQPCSRGSSSLRILWKRFLAALTSRPASESEILSSKQLPKPSFLFVAIGLALTIAPLIWPRYFFPAVWLGPIFLLDPLLEKVRIRSLSLSIFGGNRNRVWSLMLGGLLCGLMWEFWNFWAGSKWNYTVPFFGKWKVFEMPVFGFLGFLPFALECWILYHLLRAIPQRLNSRAVTDWVVDLSRNLVYHYHARN